MILQIYTIVHTLISLVAIFHRYCRRAWNAPRLPTGRLDKMVSDNGGRADRHRILFSVSRFHSSNRSRHHFAAVPRADFVCALSQTTSRRVALDLRDRRCELSLFQLVRRSGAVV